MNRLLRRIGLAFMLALAFSLALRAFMSWNFRDVLTISASAVLIIAGIVAFFILRKRRMILASQITLLSTVCLSLTSVRFFEIPALPFDLLRDLLVVFIGLLLGNRFLRSFTSKEVSETTPDYSAPHILENSIATILDSKNFLTALRSALPKGQDDEQFGLDYIPFMLSSIDERRRRAVKSARFFLLASGSSAVIFSVVVMYFGYILVNESSAGAAKSLADIKESVGSVDHTVRVLLPYEQNPDFQRNVRPTLERLEALPLGDKNKEARDKIVGAIADVKITGNLTSLANAIREIAGQVSGRFPMGTQEQEYLKSLTEALTAISSFSSSQLMAAAELRGRLEELKLLIPKADEVMSKPENRVPEIIKRLALGLVIATFFLALLRYMGSLYRTRYLQVLSAETDDFAVRRFYVAFKSSTANDEQRKAVLSSFMTAPTKNDVEGMGSDDNTKQQYEILKDLLGALSKKL